MTLSNWIKWALEPHAKPHNYHAYVLARQAARDMGVPVSHIEFVNAMKEAGYTIATRRGGAIFFAARDTLSKRKYYRQKFLTADDTAVHPLFDL